MSTAQAKTVLSLKRNLQQAISANRTQEAASVLESLKKDVVPTEELIRETKIGIAVNKLRSHADSTVSTLAKDIVRKWKNAVKDVSARSVDGPAAGPDGPQSRDLTASPTTPSASVGGDAPTPTDTAAPPVKSEPPSKAAKLSDPSKPASIDASTSKAAVKPSPSPAPPSTNGSSSSKEKVKSERGGSAAADDGGKPVVSDQPRTVQTDGVDTASDDNSTGDKTRDKCVELIYNSLASDSTAPTQRILMRSQQLERHVHKTIESSAYRAKMRSLFLNLKAANNPALRESFVSGELAVERLATMSPAEMASEEQQAENRRLAEANLFRAQGAAPQQAETDAFQCGKCKKRRTMYYQMQTRSADEPMTTFVTCLSCNNRWKFS